MVRERRDALRAVAKRAKEHPWSPIWRNIDNGHHKAFINEAQPDVVVELLDALEAAERDRDLANFAVRHSADLDRESSHAIRELLKARGVPEASFIDDYVGNAIAQRDDLAAKSERLRDALKWTLALLRTQRSVIHDRDVVTRISLEWKERRASAIIASAISALANEEGDASIHE